jgi:cytoskeletal protein RodZ
VHEIGKQLRAAREAKNISIETLSEWTKINPRYLLYIEETAWNFLPEAYIQGIVRKYAVHVGLDGDELLKQYTLFEVVQYKNDEKRIAEKSAKIRSLRSQMLLSRKIRVALFSLAGFMLLIIIFFPIFCAANDASGKAATPREQAAAVSLSLTKATQSVN